MFGREVFGGEEGKDNVFVMSSECVSCGSRSDLDELDVFECGARALQHAKRATLKNTPHLTKLALRSAFANVITMRMENAGMLEKNAELMEIKKKAEEREREERELREKEEEQERQQRENERILQEERKRVEREERERRMNGIVINADDFAHLPDNTKKITVTSCADFANGLVDFSRFEDLEELKIESNCFVSVIQMSVVGLGRLKQIEVGEGCFQLNATNSALVINNCPELVSLTIGKQSFSWFWALHLSGLPALKYITMDANCFMNTSLVLTGLKKLQSVQLGDNCFMNSYHTLVNGRSSCLG